MRQLGLSCTSAALFALALAALPLGCGGGGGEKTFVSIEVRRGNVVGAVHRIELDFTLDGRPAMVILTEPASAEIQLPTTAVVEVGSGSGQMYVVARALGADGTTLLGRGSANATVVHNETTAVTLEFGVEVQPPVDGGVDAALDGGMVAMLSVDPTSKNLGNVVVGQSSAASTFTVMNTGTGASGALAVSLTGGGAAAYAIGSGGCAGMTLAVGASCSVEVTFSPTAAGAATAQLVIAASPGGTLMVPLDGTGLPAGDLKIAPTSNDFGALVLGSASSPVTFTVRNDGGAATGIITTQLGGTDSTQFAVVSDACAGNTLAPAGTCAITARFAATTAGAKSASLTVQGTPGGAAVAQLSGMANAPATLSLTPLSFDFGDVTLPAMSGLRSFVVTNTGGVASAALASVLAGADAGQFMIMGDTCNGMTLAAAQSCTVMVLFKPTTRGAKSTTLRVTPMGGTALVAVLTGTAQTAASIVSVPAAAAFGNVTVAASAGITLTLSNPGDIATGTLATAVSGADMALFTLSANTCAGAPLMPGASCTLTVTFAPSTQGGKSASLGVTASPGGPLAVVLSGTGQAPGALSMTPAMASYADRLINDPSPVQTFMVTNTGGTATGPLATTLVGADAASFILSGNTCVNATLPAAGSCTIGVVFQPASAGPKSAQVQVVGAPGGTVTSSLSGRGLAQAALSVAPTTRDFGTVLVATQGSAQVFTVSNGGGVASGVPSVVVGGTHASNFVITANSCTAAVPAAGTCAVTVRFDPSASGARSGSLSISASPGGNTAATLTGTGQTAAVLTLSPSPLTFGTRINGTDTTLNVTVGNTGQQTTGTLGAPTSTDGTQFAIVAPTAGTACTTATTLATGATCSFGVRFRPSSSGAKSATIGIAGSPGGSPTLSATGTGQSAANLVLTPASFGFGAIEVGQTATQLFTVMNSGEQATGTLTGPTSSSGAFVVLAPPSGPNCLSVGTLAGGASCSVTVRFAPPAIGNHMGTISVSATPGNNDSSSVSGSGQTGAALTVNPSNVAFGDVDLGGSSAVTDVVLSNGGGAATGTILMPTSLDPAFRVVAPSVGPACAWPVTLAGGGMCRFGVTFTPVVTGSVSTIISLSASPGGSASVAALGTGQTPPTLDVSPATYDFGNVYVSGAVTQAFTVTNTGSRTSGGLSFSLTGSFFSNVSGGSDCQANQTLAGGATCTVQVKFTPTTPVMGAMSVLSASIPGSVDSAQLSGNGLRPGVLGIVESAIDFGLVHVGGGSAPREVTFRNDGDEPVFNLSFTAVPAGEFQHQTASGTCGAMLAAGATCRESFTTSPADGGPRAAVLSGSGMSAGAGAVSADVPASVVGAFRVAVFLQTEGRVDMRADGGPSTTCPGPGQCEILAVPGASVSLEAVNISNWDFNSWSGDHCGQAPFQPTCMFPLTADSNEFALFICPNC